MTRGYAIVALVTSMTLAGSSALAQGAPAPPPSEPPAPAWSESGAGVPSGFHLESVPRWGLIFWGSGVFFVSYLGAVGGATSNDASGWLYLPLAGPFVNVAVRNGCNGKGDDCTTLDGVQSIFLVIDGVAQLTGAAMVISGFAWPERTLVPDNAEAKRSSKPERVSWRLGPIGRSAMGLGVSGTF